MKTFSFSVLTVFTAVAQVSVLRQHQDIEETYVKVLVVVDATLINKVEKNHLEC